MEKIIGSLFLVLSPLTFSFVGNGNYEKSTVSIFVAPPTVVTTESRFSQVEEVETSEIPYETEHEEDPNLEYGREEILQEGQSGVLTQTFLVTMWEDEEIDRTLISTETEDPTPKIISKGTKIIWKVLSTGGENLDYWQKIEDVWATSYDGNCAGCRGLTYSGTLVKEGVCAVDPNVIPLGTNFYVEGYGMCRAEDIGGGIKGKVVDLGFEDVSRGFWSARYTTVYLLTNSPQGDSPN